MDYVTKNTFALCATAFLIAAAFAMIIFGNDMVRVLLVWALVFAGMSQFIAQGDSHIAQGTAWGMIIFAGLCIMIAMVVFTVSMLK